MDNILMISALIIAVLIGIVYYLYTNYITQSQISKNKQNELLQKEQALETQKAANLAMNNEAKIAAENQVKTAKKLQETVLLQQAADRELKEMAKKAEEDAKAAKSQQDKAANDILMMKDNLSKAQNEKEQREAELKLAEATKNKLNADIEAAKAQAESERLEKIKFETNMNKFKGEYELCNVAKSSLEGQITNITKERDQCLTLKENLTGELSSTKTLLATCNQDKNTLNTTFDQDKIALKAKYDQEKNTYMAACDQDKNSLKTKYDQEKNVLMTNYEANKTAAAQDKEKFINELFKYRYVKITGNDYREDSGEIVSGTYSLDQCKKLCMDNDQCHGFVRRESDGKCWLRTSANTPKLNAQFDYYYKSDKDIPKRWDETNNTVRPEVDGYFQNYMRPKKFNIKNIFTNSCFHPFSGDVPYNDELERGVSVNPCGNGTWLNFEMTPEGYLRNNHDPRGRYIIPRDSNVEDTLIRIKKNVDPANKDDAKFMYDNISKKLIHVKTKKCVYADTVGQSFKLRTCDKNPAQETFELVFYD